MAVNSNRPLLFTLRALGLGDFLAAVPAYRALRRAFPAHELRLATTAGVAPLASLTGAIDAVIPARGPDEFVVPSRRIDIAVNLHGRGPQSTAALNALSARQFISFAGPESTDVRAPRWEAAPTNERERWCFLLRCFGISADASDITLLRPACTPRIHGAVVLHPGAAYASRRWPSERFAAVARKLHADGETVVVTGSRTEIPLARGVVHAAGLAPSAMLAGATNAVELAALVAGARLVVCGDTGVAHLASAYATPSVVLFGPTSPAAWGPPASGPHTALWPHVLRDGPGNPWGDDIDPALSAIGADDVIDAAHALLAHAGERALAAQRRMQLT